MSLMFRSSRFAPFLIALAVVIGSALPAWAFSTSAKQAFVIDLSTGTVLLEKNADQIMAPSSMTKIMTAYVVYRLERQGRISFDDKFKVSRYASKRGGSTMFLREGERVSVRNLLIGLMILSGNDAAITLAENISGSEAAFSGLMNEAARSLGMTNTRFKNPSGWPAEGHYSTARDIALLSTALIQEFPQQYKMFARRDFKWGGVAQANRNPILGNIQGADGLKTGSTNAGGYGFSGSAKTGDRRIVMVVNGLKSKSARRSESRRIMDWAQRTFSTYALLRNNQVVEHAKVWMGQQATVPLRVQGDLTMTIKTASRANLKSKVIYKGPLEAPIKKGDIVGEIVISGPSVEPRRMTLAAAYDVKRVNRLAAVARGLTYSVFDNPFQYEIDTFSKN